MRRANVDDLKVGDWCFLKHDTHIAVRYAENEMTGMVILPISDTGSEVPPVWKWDGNKDCPTLTPSILVNSVPNWNAGWHGFLTAGVLVSA